MNQTINPARRQQTLRSFLEHKRTIATLASSTIILLIAPLLPASWAMISAYLISYLLVSYDVLWQSVQNIRHGELFDENFLMAIATIGALLLGDYPEAVAVMLFYQVGDLFEDVAVNRSKQSISALLAVKATTATIKTATGTQTVAPEAVTPGQLLIIKPGERVPLDGELRTGTTSLDTSALTGESLPQDVQPGDAVLSGSINLTGMIEVLVTKPYQESTIARILDLVENANQKKTTTEKFIKRFAKVYTPVVVGLAVLLAIVPPLLQVGAWATWINRALVFLVISCPCALVISVPLSFFGGIGAASRHGILIKGSNFLEALTAVKTVAFDKTGTLTQGQFTVNGVEPATDAMAATELLKLAAAVEQQSTHPIARSIVTAYTGDLSQVTVSDLTEKAGHGITATVDGQTVVVGNARAMAAHQITVPDTATTGTTIDVAVDGHYVGRITVADQPKSDAAKAISTLKHEGVTQTVLLTGDNHVIANTIGQQLGLDRVEAELLPEQKVTVMADLTQQAHPQHQKVAFVGDGINDTPVLARADVGIAMGGLGSDAAIEAADIVIMDDQPSKLAQAITIAHHTKRIVWQNIIFALVIKIGFLALGALGIAGMWEAVFADVGVTLLAVLNALRLQRL